MAKAKGFTLESFLKNAASEGAEKQFGKFGLKGIPTSWSALKDAVVSAGLYNGSKRLAPIVAYKAELWSKNYNKEQSPEEAARFGRKVENIWRRTTPFIPVAWEAGSKQAKNIKSYFNIQHDFAMALKASGKQANLYGASTSNLEMIRNTRIKLAKKTKKDFKSMFGHVISTLPAVLGLEVDKWVNDYNYSEQKKRKHNKYYTDAGETIRKENKIELDEKFTTLNKFVSTENSSGEREHSRLLVAITSMISEKMQITNLADETGRAEILKKVNDDYLGTYVIAISAGIRKYISAALGANFKNDGPFASDMVKALTAQLAKEPSPTGLDLPGASQKNCSLEDYVFDIFEKHEQESGRGEMTRVARGQLRKASHQIAQAMADPQRQLHPQALAILTDKKRGICQYHGREMTEVLEGAELDGYMAELQKNRSMSRRRSYVPPQKIYKRYQSAPEQFKESWQHLDENERFLWASFLPDEVLLDIGVAKDELQHLRHQENDLWLETVEEVMKEVSKLSQKELRELGLNEPQVKQLVEVLSQTSKRNSERYLHANRHEVVELTADIATLANSKDPDFLSKILQRTEKRRTHKNIIEEKEKDTPIGERVIADRDKREDRYR